MTQTNETRRRGQPQRGSGSYSQGFKTCDSTEPGLAKQTLYLMRRMGLPLQVARAVAELAFSKSEARS